MHELFGLSSGPLSRLFHPRCVGGNSFVSGLITVSFKFGLMMVSVGVGFEASTAISGSLPHCRPSGTRFSHGFFGSAPGRWPLYWKLPKTQPVGEPLCFTM